MLSSLPRCTGLKVKRVSNKGNKMDYVAMFKAQGGKVKTIPEGERSIDPYLKGCKCGCNGDWTDHTMRKGEKGEA